MTRLGLPSAFKPLASAVEVAVATLIFGVPPTFRAPAEGQAGAPEAAVLGLVYDDVAAEHLQAADRAVHPDVAGAVPVDDDVLDHERVRVGRTQRGQVV